jgi:predicted amidophosphoribosyltransferase
MLAMNALAELIALLAPPGCLACGCSLARADDRLCAQCVRSLAWLRSGCPRCALPKHRGHGCPAAGAAFGRAWAPVAYEGVARRLVAALKFRGALVVADLMAAHMAANLPTGLRDPGVSLVPVPAAPARRRARGFDPARALTGALARRTEQPLADCLVRGDRAARQVGAGRRERRAPGRLLVRVRGTPPPLAILVDDVHTTGATLDASARALVSAGTTVVAAISYARTL